MITEQELINDAVKRINKKLKALNINIDIKANYDTYSFIKDDKVTSSFDNLEHLLTFLDGFETALEFINDNK